MDAHNISSNCRPWMIVNIPFYFFVIGFGSAERIFGCFVNSCILDVIIRNKKMHTPSHILIFNLSLADALGILVVPFEIMTSIFWYNEDFIWKYTCYFEMFAGYMVLFGNILGINLIAWERFFSVVFPFWTRINITARVIYWVMAILWSSQLLLMLLVATVGSIGTDHNIQACLWLSMIKKPVEHVFRYVLVYFPWISTLILYLVVACLAIKRSKSKVTSKVSADQSQNATGTKHKERTTKVSVHYKLSSFYRHGLACFKGKKYITLSLSQVAIAK